MRARITPKEQGRLVLELTGKRAGMEAGLKYLSEIGVEVQSLAQDVKWHEDRCTHCTACISVCPTKALDVQRTSMEVSFKRDKCIACELCIPVARIKPWKYCFSRLLKNARLRRSPHPSSLQRTFKYASLLRISGALHLGIFEQPAKNDFSANS